MQSLDSEGLSDTETCNGKPEKFVTLYFKTVMDYLGFQSKTHFVNLELCNKCIHGIKGGNRIYFNSTLTDLNIVAFHL